MRRFSRNRHGGKLVVIRTADPQPMGVRLNRYPAHGKVVGLVFHPGFGRRRALSWVWPVYYHVQSEDRRLRWFMEQGR